MSRSHQKPDTARALAGLRDFQRRTVDYVFHRLYEKGGKRFLVADEVGLGKTFVARGLVARAIDHLWPRLDRIRRIDVIYICSNQDIARQNINRLNVFTDQSNQPQTFATRLTYLPTQVRQLDDNVVNFIAFSPGTSFNLAHATGRWKERRLLYYMLKDEWDFGEYMAPKNLFQCHMDRDRWHSRIAEFAQELTDDPTDLDGTYIDPGIWDRFLDNVDADSEIPELREQALAHFARFQRTVSSDAATARTNLIGRLRRHLAMACIDRLEPDIVILDEFQRFRDLLRTDTEDEAGELAQQLFQWSYEHEEDDDDPRIILLSATPYKPFTLDAEASTEDHYSDFVDTAEFLLGSKEEAQSFQVDLGRYRDALFATDDASLERTREARSAIEERLRRVMVRTERLSVTTDRNGMLECSEERYGRVRPEDLRQYRTIDSVAQLLNKNDPVEYWKSSPYLLNAMDRRGYKIKESFVQEVDGQAVVDDELLRTLRTTRDGLLQWRDVEAYRRIDPGNARLRALLEETVEQETWQLLWIPATSPYYRPEKGPYARRSAEGFSKFLVFSAWRVVPKVVAMLTSYEAERRMCQAALRKAEAGNRQYTGWYGQRSPMLDFPLKNGKPQRMNALLLFYPCLTLTFSVDPMLVSASLAEGEQLPSYRAVRRACINRIEALLRPIVAQHGSGDRTDRRWYWIAPALLDRLNYKRSVETWIHGWTDRTRGERGGRFGAYADLFGSLFDSPPLLGAPPQDLAEVLAEAALGSPAILLVRSLARVSTAMNDHDDLAELQKGAAHASLGFRSLFNNPAVVAMLRRRASTRDRRYWQKVLQYSAQGNLQAVLDEYAHMAVESLGLIDKPLPDAIDQLSKEIRDAVAVRTVSLSMDEIRVSTRYPTVTLRDHSLRCRYALRYGDGKAIDRGGDGRGDLRRKQVQQAFNSPFWPFVLATTSIGQEGLDFHPFCHNVFHWNLPSNPVDLEQREGRVHRYKGHAIRKNLAAYYPFHTISREVVDKAKWRSSKALPIGPDVWSMRFEKASRDSDIKGDFDDLVPFWVFPGGEHKIRRFAPVVPMSRDESRLDNLQKGLGAYRLAFGQPRQEDLLAFLRSRFGDDIDTEVLEDLMLDLSP